MYRGISSLGMRIGGSDGCGDGDSGFDILWFSGCSSLDTTPDANRYDDSHTAFHVSQGVRIPKCPFDERVVA